MKVHKDRGLEGKAERETCHPSVVFQAMVVSQQHCCVFCLLEEVKGSFDCQEQLVPDVICLSGSKLLREKGTDVELPLRADLLREDDPYRSKASTSTMKGHLGSLGMGL